MFALFVEHFYFLFWCDAGAIPEGSSVSLAMNFGLRLKY